MADGNFRRVPSTVVIGPHGPMVTRGYTEIAGIRFYDDRLVVGRHGEYVIERGYAARNPTGEDVDG